MVEGIDLEIHVPEGFPEKYRPALVRVAEGCAVKKHLEHPPAFSIRTLVAGVEA
jgi:ribosomal protein S12 methylthiotransferase accessory factor